MLKQRIPGTDLDASLICMGTVSLGSTIDDQESFRLLDTFVDLGGNFLDTALNYADWLDNGVKASSEKLLGRWLKQRKGGDRIILGTKGACPTAERFFRLKREDILSDLEKSLTHLQTDCIDFYWLHRDDTSEPVEGIIDVLNEQVQAGKIRYFGCSNWTLERIQEAQQYALQQGKQGFSGNQMMWSLADPNFEKFADKTMVLMDEQTKAFHEQVELAAVPFSSQAGGFFSGRYSRGVIPQGKEDFANQYFNEVNFNRLDRVQEVARQLGQPSSVIALSYMLSQPFPVYPIIGSHTVQQLTESCAAGDLRLDSDTVRYLEA
ncbi:aldo/keto reductase [Paenibacillus eucommiae]|uniref:Aryl-alcohol dehydrogenase-like predicted oxidoreductase n=1 Tax=Paenibacillus eucommiae TaxID=1355755 RepID=A0ABS4IXW4_9BACL|nr:aldo/keto reductase [Paenibacillus eucommiae]MBP1992403.1 aryl-alcohol dehydrogenase-like predicted oxidoreductase [Paenibacillus eucommiae]